MHFLCNGIKLALDNRHGDVSFVSHAHSDHAGGLKRQKKLLASEETIALADFKSSQNITVENAKLLEAGHMLGAKQLLVESDGATSVYTGDISLKKNIFGFSAEIPKCDKLIIEATYGKDPAYKFPDHEEIYSEIEKWIKGNDDSNLLLGCYDMGKAQEMIKILNERCGVSPIVTEKAEKFSKVYDQFGIKLDRVVIGSDEAEEIMNKRFVAIVPMRHAKLYFAAKLEEAFGRKTLVAVATGWALNYRFNADASFPLSDHADFYELVEYIKQSEAKEVEFFAGSGTKIMKYLKDGFV